MRTTTPIKFSFRFNLCMEVYKNQSILRGNLHQMVCSFGSKLNEQILFKGYSYFATLEGSN
jgi:hypothetical protein